MAAEKSTDAGSVPAGVVDKTIEIGSRGSSSDGRSPSKTRHGEMTKNPLTVMTAESTSETARGHGSGGDGGLERTLSARHLVVMAIAGSVGLGIFLSTGPALAKSGPASLLIAFIIVGGVTYSVMVSLGEMCSYMPVAGSFTTYASRLLSRSAGFSMGWLYLLSWVLTYGLQLTACGLILEFWLPSLNMGIWIAIFWVAISALNFMPVRWVAEFETWLSSVKVVTMLGFFIFGICVNAGVGDQGYIGFRYWHDPGAFAAYKLADGPGKALGFISALIAATFTFHGAELAVLGAGETIDPRRAIPRAISWTFWTMFVLFIATILLVGLNVPRNHPLLQSSSTNASASPLVISAQLAGVFALSHILNAVLLTAVLTAACSNVYSGSRILVGLAEQGLAPALFLRTNRFSTPHWSVAFSAAFGLLGFLNLSPGGKAAFEWLLNLTTVSGIITWSIISLSHLRFRWALAAQNIDLAELPYRAPLQPWLSWFGFAAMVIAGLTSGFTVLVEWNTADFLTAYLTVFIFVVLYAGYEMIYRTGIVKLADVELREWRRSI